MIEVFHIDDDIEYANSLKSFAYGKGIQITHVTNFQKMKDVLPLIFNNISMVIIDIKGKFIENDEFDDESVLAAVIEYLDKQYQNIPRLILTGDKEGFKYVEKYRKDEKIFSKGNTEELKMFEYIKQTFTSSDDYKLYTEFKDVLKYLIKIYSPNIGRGAS